MVSFNPDLANALRSRRGLGFELLPVHADRLEEVRAARRAVAARLAQLGHAIDPNRWGAPPPTIARDPRVQSAPLCTRVMQTGESNRA